MDEEDSGYCEADNMSLAPASKFVFCAECERNIGMLEEYSQ